MATLLTSPVIDGSGLNLRAELAPDDAAYTGTAGQADHFALAGTLAQVSSWQIFVDLSGFPVVHSHYYVIVTFDKPVKIGESVTLSYTRANDATDIKADGTALANFAGMATTNNSQSAGAAGFNLHQSYHPWLI